MLILNELLRWVREREGGSFRQMLLFEEGLGRGGDRGQKGEERPTLRLAALARLGEPQALYPGRSSATETNGTNE